jgi:hypothetical protein
MLLSVNHVYALINNYRRQREQNAQHYDSFTITTIKLNSNMFWALFRSSSGSTHNLYVKINELIY